MRQSKIRIAIVDDHPIVIEGLKTLLLNRADITVTGCFIDGAGILSYIQRSEVDVILLDVTLPDINGIELCQKIKAISTGIIVLILSNHCERSIIMQTIQNGASGYLLKNASPEELINCIYEALDGGIAFSKAIAEIISRPARNALQGVPQLTKREKQLIKLLAEGKTSAAIAEMLFLSPLTVNTHRRNLITKFKVSNTIELLREAAKYDLL